MRANAGDWLSLLVSGGVSRLRSEQDDVDDIVALAGPDPWSNVWPKCSHRHFASILEGHCTCVSGWFVAVWKALRGQIVLDKEDVAFVGPVPYDSDIRERSQGTWSASMAKWINPAMLAARSAEEM